MMRMDRADQEDPRRHSVLEFLPLQSPGLEIAPYFNPFISADEYDVFYVDCIDNDEIQAKAAANPGAAGVKIPLIDAVWIPGMPLSKCVGRRKFRYALASHVMEHVPNPLGWLCEIADCLEEGGLLALLLPDRRGTMDYYRRESTFADVVGWFIEKPARPTPTQVMDFLSQSFTDAGALDFSQMPTFVDAPRHYSDSDALSFARMVVESAKYLDVHVSVWTPDTFKAVFERVIALGLLPFQITGIHRLLPGFHSAEFLVLMQKRSSKVVA
jgi:hypothetical protein